MSQDTFGNYQVELEPSAVTPGNSISGGNFLIGSGAPDNSLGSDGMGYGDSATGDIYTKSGGTWTLFAGGGASGAQIKTYVDNPNDETVVPDDIALPAIAYGTSGIAGQPIYTWDVGSGLWSEASVDMFGNGSPVGVVTPGRIGQLYRDAAGAAFWQSTGLSANDWFQWV